MTHPALVHCRNQHLYVHAYICVHRHSACVHVYICVHRHSACVHVYICVHRHSACVHVYFVRKYVYIHNEKM